MIPAFPDFKKLELRDKDTILNFTKQFSPYNDFEFIDLWIYNPKDNTSISFLDNNLIVKRQDYITDDYFYTFLGTNNVKKTILALLQKSKEEKALGQLLHVPEINFMYAPHLRDDFSIREDPNDFDYILSVDELAELRGKKYYDKRNLVNRFKKTFPEYSIQQLNLAREETQQEIRGLFSLWEQQKEKKRSETEIELIAIGKLFDLIKICDISGLGVYYKNNLIGFTTYHLLHQNYAGMSFEKGDASYDGIYAFLNHETAKKLKELGAQYLNYEQDLGIPGLRKAKQLWRPLFFLKKYIVEEKI